MAERVATQYNTLQRRTGVGFGARLPEAVARSIAERAVRAVTLLCITALLDVGLLAAVGRAGGQVKGCSDLARECGERKHARAHAALVDPLGATCAQLRLERCRLGMQPVDLRSRPRLSESSMHSPAAKLRMRMLGSRLLRGNA